MFFKNLSSVAFYKLQNEKPRGSSHTDLLFCPRFLLLQHAVHLWNSVAPEMVSTATCIGTNRDVYERSFCRHEEQRYSGTKWRQCDHFRSMFWLYCTNVLLSVKNRAWHVRNCVCGGLMETESLRWPSHCQTRPQAKSFSSGEGPFCSLMSNNG